MEEFTLFDSSDLRILMDVVGIIQHFLERVVVQRQVLAFVSVIAIAWLLSRGLWFLVFQGIRFWIRVVFDERKQHQFHLQLKRILPMFEIESFELTIKHILFPLISLVGLYIVEGFFVQWGWHIGFLNQLNLLLYALLFYEIILALFYLALGKSMRRYHYRFLAPMFGFLILIWFINNLVPITALAGIKLWQGFTSQVTIGTFSIAVVGFYFWYDGTGIAQDILRSIITVRAKVEPGLVESSLTIARYLLILGGVVVFLTLIGMDSTVIGFITGGLSVGIGFGSQAIVGNLASGIILLVDQSIRPGDIVKIEGEMGIVKHLGMRATTVNTLNNVEVIIPNQTLLTSSVTTYTGTNQVIRTLIPVETADAYSPELVREGLLAAAARHEMVAKEPKPTIFFDGSGDTSLLFRLAVWFDDPTRTAPLTSEIYFLIYEEFDKRGIQPSTPQRDLQIINDIPWEIFEKQKLSPQLSNSPTQ